MIGFPNQPIKILDIMSDLTKVILESIIDLEIKSGGDIHGSSTGSPSQELHNLGRA